MLPSDDELDNINSAIARFRFSGENMFDMIQCHFARWNSIAKSRVLVLVSVFYISGVLASNYNGHL